eukprot:5463409-Amphidinium_carterae.1
MDCKKSYKSIGFSFRLQEMHALALVVDLLAVGALLKVCERSNLWSVALAQLDSLGEAPSAHLAA